MSLRAKRSNPVHHEIASSLALLAMTSIDMPMILPDRYRGIPEDELSNRILEIKRCMGSDLFILGHYYEREEVVRFADREGDSFELAKAGASSEARFIIFCGVYFMAEASVVLARPGQRVFLPNMEAGCPLADMAEIADVEAAWKAISASAGENSFLPIAYMNSSAAIKAFCGRNGGLVCTSSSVLRAFEWAAKKGKRVFFLPDQNLGLNTLRSLGVRERIPIWDPRAAGGGIDPHSIENASAILWNGFCHVHTLFSTDHVKEARKMYPGCKVVIHPESRPEVVDISDGAGSTSYLKRFAEEAQKGSTVVIGTEISFVSRLAAAMPEKRIVPLERSLCPNMFRTSPADLLWTLEKIGNVNEISLLEGVAADAKLALERMLSL